MKRSILTTTFIILSYLFSQVLSQPALAVAALPGSDQVFYKNKTLSLQPVAFSDSPAQMPHFTLQTPIDTTLSSTIAVDTIATKTSMTEITSTVTSIRDTPVIDITAVDKTMNVELLTWHEASAIIDGGTIIEVEDIWTGLTYTLRCASISGHADVEPLTAEDTEIIYRTRDGIWSWDARPVWVTIDGRILAASINGQPHAGSTISENNMQGHLCLHFSGTVTNSKSYQEDLRSAISVAWEMSLPKIVPIDQQYVHAGPMRIV